jgi:hypothetical protein
MISLPLSAALSLALVSPFTLPAGGTLLASAAVAAVAAPCGVAGHGLGHDLGHDSSDPLREVYEGGMLWADFLARVEANQRRALWDRNWETGQVPSDLLARAQAVGGGPWRILAITDPACSDSVNTIPYLAHLAEALPSVEIRVVSALQGRPWMEAHRSPDGRASTPTVLLLDEDYTLRGCWIEQPQDMAAFWLDIVARGTMTQEVGRKLAWYEEDQGRSTLREFIEVLEAAQTDTPRCPGLNA